MVEFKIGDRVEQINRDYIVSMRGWRGTVQRVSTIANMAWIQFDNHPDRELDVALENIKLIERNKRLNFDTVDPINTPEK